MVIANVAAFADFILTTTVEAVRRELSLLRLSESSSERKIFFIAADYYFQWLSREPNTQDKNIFELLRTYALTAA